MESLIATDGYFNDDPLFDLFEEEMRSSRAAAQMMQPANTAFNSASTSNADYFNDYDLNNNNYNSYYKQTDELSIILGLEWLPSNDLTSPSTTTSSSSSSASSDASSTSSASSPSSTSPASSSSLYSDPHATNTSSAANTLHQVAPTSTATNCTKPASNKAAQQQQQQHQTIKPAPINITSNNNNNNLTTSCNNQQRVFRIQLQNHNSSNKQLGNLTQSPLSHSNELNQPTSGHTNQAFKHKSCLVVNSNNNLIASNLIESAQIVNANLKRKKKCLKTRCGTSLLAQPSPKLSNCSTSSSSISSSSSLSSATSSSSATTTTTLAAANVAANGRVQTLPTLITINRPPSTIITPLQQKHQQQMLIPTIKTTLHSTTTILNNNLNQTIPLTCIAGKANSYFSNGISSTTNNNLTKLERTMRYCIKIEHAYAAMCL